MVASCGLIKVLNGVCVVYSVMPCGRRTVVYKIGMRLCIGSSCGVRRLMDGNEIHRIAAAGVGSIAGEDFFNGYLSACGWRGGCKRLTQINVPRLDTTERKRLL